MSLTTQLAKIQKDLKVHKGHFNKFGNYKYRSCEDILEALKPLLNGLIITISDEIINIGDRFYVKATATISDGVDAITTTSYAREEETKKGMDGAQVTGSASSYARKYALNGLFGIDDTKDSDTTNKHGKEETKVRGIDDLTAGCKALSNQLTDEKLKAKVLISITKAKTEKELQRIYDKLKVVA